MTFRDSAIWKCYPESEQNLRGIKTYGRLFTGARWVAVLGIVLAVSMVPSIPGVLNGLLMTLIAMRIGVWAREKQRRCESEVLAVDTHLNALADIFEVSTAKLVSMRPADLSNQAIGILARGICEAEILRSKMITSRPWLRPVGLRRKWWVSEQRLGLAEGLLLDFQVIESGTFDELTLLLTKQKLGTDLVSA